MKKLLALVLAVVMCLGLASAAFAIDTTYAIDFDDSYIDKDGDVIVGNPGVLLVTDDYFYAKLANATIENNVINPEADDKAIKRADYDDVLALASAAAMANVAVTGAEGYDADPAELTGDALAAYNGLVDDFIDGFIFGAARTNVKAVVTKGSSVVKAEAVYDDVEGWLVKISPVDKAVVTEHDVKIEVRAVSQYWDLVDEEVVVYEAKGDIEFSITDTGVIGKKDIETALKFDGEVWTNDRYIVSADAFKAAKGETIKFPYDGYTITIENCQITEALNFRADSKSINSIVKKYGEDNTMAFLVFADSNIQPSELKIAAEIKEFSTFKGDTAYVYRVDGDDLVLVTDKAAYDDDRTEVTFTTNKLGAFVVSAKAIEGAKTDSSKTNPGTGANDVIGLAVAGAVVAMAAGFVALKK